MALPSSGTITLSDVNTNVGSSSTATIGINDYTVRQLANGNTTTNPVSMNSLYGKSWQWVSNSNLSSTVYNLQMYSNAIDSVGNQYLSWQQAVYDSGSGTYTYTTYVGKINAAGGLVWVKQINKGSNNYAVGQLNVDSSGNVYVVVGGVSAYVNYYPGLVKLNSSGTVQWSITLTTPWYNAGVNLQGAVGFDSSGYIYAAVGYPADFSNYGSYMIKVDSSGNVQWQKKVNNVNVTQTAFDSTNNSIYVAGTWSGYASYDGWLGKFDTSLSLTWGREIPNNAYISGLAVDSNGNAYTAYNTYVAGFSRYAEILQKVDSSGNFSWSTGVSSGVTPTQYSNISVDSSNNVYMKSSLFPGYYLAKFNSSGTVLAKMLIQNVSANVNISSPPAFMGGFLYMPLETNSDRVTYAPNGFASFKISTALTTSGTYGSLNFSAPSATYGTPGSYTTVARSTTASTTTYTVTTGLISVTDVTSSYTNAITFI